MKDTELFNIVKLSTHGTWSKEARLILSSGKPLIDVRRLKRKEDGKIAKYGNGIRLTITEAVALREALNRVME